MPPLPSNQHAGMRGPSAFDKSGKMGAMMGGSVGLIMGFIFGGFNIMRYGAGTQGPLRMLGTYMIGSGATFGFFMSIGSVIRTEAPPGMNPIVYSNLMGTRRHTLEIERRKRA